MPQRCSHCHTALRVVATTRGNVWACPKTQCRAYAKATPKWGRIR